jgi:hypothetical protein
MAIARSPAGNTYPILIAGVTVVRTTVVDMGSLKKKNTHGGKNFIFSVLYIFDLRQQIARNSFYT